MYYLIWLLQFYDVSMRTQFGVAGNERIEDILEILSSKLFQ